jgi:hypothetical protein
MLFWQQFNLTNLHVALCLTSSNTEHCIVEAKVVAAVKNSVLSNPGCRIAKPLLPASQLRTRCSSETHAITAVQQQSSTAHPRTCAGHTRRQHQNRHLPLNITHLHTATPYKPVVGRSPDAAFAVQGYHHSGKTVVYGKIADQHHCQQLLPLSQHHGQSSLPLSFNSSRPGASDHQGAPQ